MEFFILLKYYIIVVVANIDICCCDEWFATMGVHLCGDVDG